MDTPSACHKDLWPLIQKNLGFGIKISENTPDDLKQQLEKCKQVNNAYWMLLGQEKMKTESGWIGNLQRNFIEVGKIVDAFFKKQEMFTWHQIHQNRLQVFLTQELN